MQKTEIEILQVKSLLFLPSTLSNFHVFFLNSGATIVSVWGQTKLVKGEGGADVTFHQQCNSTAYLRLVTPQEYSLLLYVKIKMKFHLY